MTHGYTHYRHGNRGLTFRFEANIAMFAGQQLQNPLLVSEFQVDFFATVVFVLRRVPIIATLQR